MCVYLHTHKSISIYICIYVHVFIYLYREVSGLSPSTLSVLCQYSDSLIKTMMRIFIWIDHKTLHKFLPMLTSQ
jgi:hypothetical protein